MSLSVVILAAGAGRRLRAGRPKPLAELAGRALILRTLDAVRPLRPGVVVVVVNPRDARTPAVVRGASGESELAAAPVFAMQGRARGTGHAAACALPFLPSDGAVLIVFADSPLLRTARLRQLVRRPDALSLLVFRPEDPRGYGRVARDAGGAVVDIVEERDAGAAARRLGEAYSGALCAPAGWLKSALPRLRPAGRGGEIYLTGLPALAVRDGVAVRAVVGSPEEAMGVNSAAELARAEAVLRRWEADKLLARGVQLADPLRVDIRGVVRGGRGGFVDANVLFVGEVVLGEGCRIGANCVLENCVVGKDAVVHPFSHISGAKLGAGCEVGPFARLRPGTALAVGAKVGNFVEVKNSRVGAGAKAGHLAYVGDAEIGAGANLGAGTITCNYDGQRKHRTRVGAGAFVGSGTQLVAPVEVGRGAYVAAGSVITRRVSAGALAFGRARQSEKPGRRTAGTGRTTGTGRRTGGQ